MSDILEKPPARSRRAVRSRVEPVDTGPRNAKLNQPLVENKSIFHPAIYYINPLHAAIGEWPHAFARAASMGFNTVLLATPFATAAGVTQDYDVVDERLGGGDALKILLDASAAAKQAGLVLTLDLDISRIAIGSPLLDEYPDWFIHTAEGAAFRFLAENDATVDWWIERLAAFQDAGIAGFRCLSTTSIPPAVWSRLIDAAKQRHPETRFMAWTAGATPTAIADLANSGFDYSFSSSCWWDFRAGWLNDDAARIAKIGPAIALTNPIGGSSESTEQTRRRALSFAALYGAGWLMPMGFEHGGKDPATTFDLTSEITALNAFRLQNNIIANAPSAEVISSTGADIAILRRGDSGQNAIIITANPSLDRTVKLEAGRFISKLGAASINRLSLSEGTDGVVPSALQFPPGAVMIFSSVATKAIESARSLQVDCSAPRLAIEAITPKVDEGEFPVRRTVGGSVVVEADIIADGHDKLAAELLWRPINEEQWTAVPMTLINNDRWTAEFPLHRLGRYVYAVSSWKDVFASFADELTKKHIAGVPTALEIKEGLLLVTQAAEAGLNKTSKPLKALLKSLQNADDNTRRTALLSDKTAELMRAGDVRKFFVQSENVIVDAERLNASFASWFEIFPRSQSGDTTRHGTFLDVIKRLPDIADMGFDVLYFPPIHPIGRINRKGRNNTLTPAPEDPGSPYAIGTSEGGHDAIHPELGSLADFRLLLDEAAKHGIELALDFAIQCAPDHPWLKEHPEWFDWRPDGSLRYAENPPKKYEDIVNVDFYTEGAMPALWIALRDVVQFWVDQGVRLFRVDNPHTKPLPFWQWLIDDIRGRHPDAVFLAEAFTRPKVMYRLAKIGFSQSYTYFTWRNTKQELQTYLTELTTTAPKDFFRPHFFVNTPDINPAFLHRSGRAGFLIRAALAATLSGLWGVYNGFEYCESAAVPGKEEYLNSEKYEIKSWTAPPAENIIPEISRLNRIRRSNAALQTHLGVEFLNAFNDQVLYFLKMAPDGNAVLIAISLDPFNVQDAEIEIPLWRFGLADDASLAAEDLMREHHFVWHGKRQIVRLNPQEQPFCIWRIQPLTH